MSRIDQYPAETSLSSDDILLIVKNPATAPETKIMAVGDLLNGFGSLLIVSDEDAPASASDIGDKGEIRITSTYLYVCINTNSWIRFAISSWE